MTANTTGSIFLSLLSFLSLILFACETESSTPTNLTFVATQLSIHDQKLVSLGSAYNQSSIRFPAIQVQNKKPIIFPSNTSARGILMKTNQSDQAFVSYYQAKDLDQQEEISRLFSLNSEYGLDPIISYGHRSRIVDFIPMTPQQFVCLNYERETANSSVLWIEDKTIRKKVAFTVGEETTIPKQIKQLENGDLLITGIADGFTFKDGHSYKKEFSQGFILLTDNEGVEKNRWLKSDNAGHVFFEKLQVSDTHIYISGSVQQGNSGLDVCLIKLDKQLNQINESVFTESHHQEILDIELSKNKITLFIKSYNDTDKQELLIKELSHQMSLLKESKVDSVFDSNIKDMKPMDNSIYLLAHEQKNQIDIPNTTIVKLNSEQLSN